MAALGVAGAMKAKIKLGMGVRNEPKTRNKCLKKNCTQALKKRIKIVKQALNVMENSLRLILVNKPTNLKIASCNQRKKEHKNKVQNILENYG